MPGESPTLKSPQDFCNELLTTLRESNLHYIISESPYLVQICVRKKFLDTVQEQKKSAPSFTKMSGFENKIEDLENRNASLRTTLEDAKEDITNLDNKNKILLNRIENVVKETKENEKKFEDETAFYKAKVKSLEKSLKAKVKKIEDAEKNLDKAHDTIEQLQTVTSTCTHFETKFEAVENKLDEGDEYYENNDTKDNNNLFL